MSANDVNPTSSGSEDENVQQPEESQSAAETEGGYRLSLDVDIADTGPCRKHVRVRVPRQDLDHYYEDSVSQLASTAAVPGFRVGRVPKQLISRRFRKELADEVKQKVLIESLEQLSEDYDLDPINEPNLDPEAIEVPEDGDFEYEFDVEVRPDFDLPPYEGLEIERPIHDVSDDDVDRYLERFLSQYSKLVPHDGPAAKGDAVVVDIEFTHNGDVLRRMSEVTLRLKPVLRFYDAELADFDSLMEGVRAGESREADLEVSQEAAALSMRGEVVHARFAVLDVKRVELPEVGRDFLQRVGVEGESELRDEIRAILERQVTYEQRQTVRQQVLEKITESADWDLPEELVSKQVENALHREILEMQQAGFTTREIQARENEIRQQSLTSTRQAMKEHFVLDKIATNENIEVLPSEIDLEIRLMASQRGESPRRLRARLDKSGVIENLEAQIRERKAVDVILARAVFKDVSMERDFEDRIEAVNQSVCGDQRDAAAEAAAEDEEVPAPSEE